MSKIKYMNINPYFLFIFIIPVSVLVGFLLALWYILHTIKKATGVKSWKEFINQAKKAQKMQKKIEKEGIFGVMNDPELMKQMEDLRKRFGRKPK